MHAVWISNYIFITKHMFYILNYTIELINSFISDAALDYNDYRIMDRNCVSYSETEICGFAYLLWKYDEVDSGRYLIYEVVEF